MASSHQLLTFLQISQPIFLLLVFFIAFIASSAHAARSASKHDRKTQFGPGGKPLPKRLRSTMNTWNLLEARIRVPSRGKSAFTSFVILVMGTLVVDAAIHMTHVLVAKSEHWWCGQAVVIYVVGSFFSHTVVLLSLLDNNPSPTYAQVLPWTVAIIFESAILFLSLSVYVVPHHEPIVGDLSGGPLRRTITTWELLEVGTGCIRLLFLSLMVALYLVTPFYSKKNARKISQSPFVTEATGLLDNSILSSDDSYGSTEGLLTPKASEPWAGPNTTPSTSWWEYLSGYSLLLPYLWPSKSRQLQLVVIACFVLLILQRIVNLLVPYQVGVVTDSMSISNGQIQVPWLQICLYVLCRYLQGSQGLLESIRSNMWTSVSQSSYMELSTAAFEHIHNLSLDFHLGKKMGEALSALTKGSSINTFLEQVTFQVIPMMIDLCVAIGYFLIVFDAYYALVLAIFIFFYVYVTIRIAIWRAETRMQMVNASRQEDTIKNDSLVSYETVKYFNAEDYEIGRYQGAVTNLQHAESHSLFAQNLMSICQNTIFMLGLLVMCFIAAYQVSLGQRPVSQFVILLTYMTQLQTPLTFFGTFYRYMQSALINSERLLELFREQPSVIDKPSAKPLPYCRGSIVFDNVAFAYDDHKPALTGLTFHCKPGTTTALVGETGGGRSTIFRLLFRFYDIDSGRILLDGRDVEDITIKSLRSHVGVVPQTPMFFNGSIMYNLRYANQNATDHDIYEACRAAGIHDKIMAFLDGYETKIGDRGLRLGGGEKQRIAIAQVILKNPPIVLLEEATASLDTETEHIQDALWALSRGRTVLIIAHRLRTVTTADSILVLHEGCVAESGTHNELLAMKNRYSKMWQKQVQTQRDAERTRARPSRAS
ncbi:heavy metal tolerance protein precursor [Penicillium taxi]|uniref:heavy metal tolerance protein precursor n=1 Tax=Penicillium taxi TaxID=168475 RepID=UPI00254517DC|nr:heavy metal tolerance protein precursor [Penicillium taxi]KAJ5901987.1 heavy metal tolerance protein precursor [Penicillium taxi]